MGKLNVPKLLKAAKGFIVENSPEILVGMGLVAVGSAIYMVAKVTPKALQRIEDEIREREDLTPDVGVSVEELPSMLPLRDKFKLTWKLYLPAAITFATGTTCIVGASAVNAKRNAALATACTVAESALIDYAAKVKELVGEEKDAEIQQAIMDERLHKARVEVEPTDGDEPVRCYDVWAGREFYATENQIKAGVNELNSKINTYMSASMNELYYAWGTTSTDGGEALGWNINTGLVRVSLLPVFNAMGKPCMGIKLNPPPIRDYTRIV